VPISSKYTSIPLSAFCQHLQRTYIHVWYYRIGFHLQILMYVRRRYWVKMGLLGLLSHDKGCVRTSLSASLQKNGAEPTTPTVCTVRTYVWPSTCLLPLELMWSFALRVVQWNVVGTVEPLYKGHLFNEDTVCCPNHIELSTDPPLGPNGVLYREVPLYTGQPAGSQWCPL